MCSCTICLKGFEILELFFSLVISNPILKSPVSLTADPNFQWDRLAVPQETNFSVPAEGMVQSTKMGLYSQLAIKGPLRGKVRPPDGLYMARLGQRQRKGRRGVVRRVLPPTVLFILFL